MARELEDNFEEVGRRLRAFLSKAASRLGPEIRDALDKDGLLWAKEVTGHFSGPARMLGRPRGDDRLGVVTGQTRKSFGHRVTGATLADLRLVKFTTSPIAVTNEFGATIRPVHSRYLTIPMPAALTASGVPRETSARNWPDTWVEETQGGHLMIFHEDPGEAGVAEPLYLLHPGPIQIPPRLNMRKAHADRGPTRRRQLARAVLAAFQKAR